MHVTDGILLLFIGVAWHCCLASCADRKLQLTAPLPGYGHASHKAHIFVLLTSSAGTTVDHRLIELWRQAAHTFGDVKFCQTQADLCIEGYPDRNTPTIIIYRAGDIVRQIVTLRELNGDKTDMRDLEDVLKSVGAVKPGDSRLLSRNDPTGATTRRPADTLHDDSDGD